MAKVLYLGIFLTEESIKKLRKRFPPIFKNLPPDPHITLVFKPNEEEIHAFTPLIGSRSSIGVIGYALDSKAEAVLVLDPKLTASRNKCPHITISTDDGVPPVWSNSLLESARAEGRMVYFLGERMVRWEDMEPFTLEGICDTFPRSVKE